MFNNNHSQSVISKKSLLLYRKNRFFAKFLSGPVYSQGSLPVRIETFHMWYVCSDAIPKT